MREEIIELKGEAPGPTSIILAGVHGDELCGPLAFEKILPNLTIERGQVFFGYGNPQAIEKNVRQLETNLNRMFKSDEDLNEQDKNSYEYKRAQFLKIYLDQSSALLDIHASSDPKSPPFIICEANGEETARCLPVNLVVSGFDKIEPGGTDYYMNKNGNIGVCIECGYRGDPTTSQTAETAIINFLISRGHITGSIETHKQSPIKIFNLYFSQTNHFRLAKDFADFTKIKSGEIIGLDGNKEIRAPKDCAILFAQNTNKIGDEAFLLGTIE